MQDEAAARLPGDRHGGRAVDLRGAGDAPGLQPSGRATAAVWRRPVRPVGFAQKVENMSDRAEGETGLATGGAADVRYAG